jgi:membrane fusion protein, multidrug efflux system
VGLLNVQKRLLILLLALLSAYIDAAEKKVPVRVAAVDRIPLQQTITLPGEILSQRVSNLSSRVDAMVQSVNVEEGDKVKAGQTLIKLDDELARIDLMRATAAVEEARVQLAESQRQSRELANLISDKFIAKTAFEAAEAKVNSNKAVLKRLQAEQQRFRELLDRHVIKAPYGGVISAKLVEAGQWVKVGNTVLTLTDNYQLRARVFVPQRIYTQIQPNNPVQITTDTRPGIILNATISAIIPVADSQSHQFPVHINLLNQHQQWAPGMTVSVSLATDQTNGAVLTVPRDALIIQPDQNEIVWKIRQLDKTHSVQRIPVHSVQTIGDRVQIETPDLVAGDQVVIRGNEILKQDQPVRIIQ